MGRLSLVRLYVEEMKGLPRGRFALAGAAALMAFVAFLAVAIAPDALRAFGIFAFLIVPTFVAPLAAARMASPRATRFHHSLFTAPVTQGAWFGANVLVSLTVGLLYLVATAPVLAVIAMHVGTDGEIFRDLLPVAVGIVLFGAALGTFLGVAFTGRAAAAPIGLATAVMLVSVMAGFFLSQVLAARAPSEFLLGLLHLFPHVNLLDATASPMSAGKAPTEPGLAAAALGASVVGLLALAAWVYLREQGPEDWETTPRRRALVALAVVAVVLAPAAVASAEYEDAELDGPQVHFPGPRPTGVYAAIAPRGADPAGLDLLNPTLNTFDAPLVANEANEVEMILVFPFGANATLRNVSVAISLEGEDPWWHNATYGSVAPAETARLPAAAPGGPEHGVVLRVPMTVTPEDPRALTKNFYMMHVHVDYEVEGHAEPYVGHAMVPFSAAVPDAATHLLAASVPVPLVLVGAAAARRLRVR